MTFFFEQATVISTELLDCLPIRLYARTDSRQLFSPADIVCLEAEKNYCWVCLKDGQRLLTTKTLKHHHSHLPANWFVRLHRNCVVNRQFIEKIEFADGSYRVDVTTGESFPVSRRRWKEIRRQLLGNQAIKSRSIMASFR
ncbi:LytR/AlgR family response regulator transcription factor [Spirosoma endbachense]|uniref:Response regulator receiver protein n=1 Tax=Spirosoma endbachense TaxID=2666025 RepID=A0A6P1W0F2_9BACT|nr:LytTR family DNA-binding domain-containing protein [Spirosoma endbachense]QHV98863.1 response regulator receiver protein [Spirosoma endbachense]